MPKRTNQTSEKRQLDDPGDVSITRAPPPPKKNRSKAIDAASTDSTTPPNPNAAATTGPPKKALRSGSKQTASVTAPGPASVKTTSKAKKLSSAAEPVLTPPEPEAPTPTDRKSKRQDPTVPTQSQPKPESEPESEPKSEPGPNHKLKSAPVAKKKPTPRPPPPPVDTPEAVQNDDTEVASPKAIMGKSKRDKKPSPVAQKVDEQRAAKQKLKDEKADKKAAKEAKVVVNETAEETEAFLKQLGVLPSQPSPTISISATASTAQVPKPPIPPKPPAVARRAALDQLIRAHHQPSPPPSTISIGSVGSSAVSVTPSDSISQVGSSQPNLPGKSSRHLKLQTAPTPPSHSTLQVPSPIHHLSREVSPVASSVATNLDEDGSDPTPNLEPFDFNALMKDLPAPFACEIPEPVELSGDLHHVELESSAIVDFTGLKGSARTKERRKQENPTISMVRRCDQGVVSLACNVFEISVYLICGFPSDDQAYALASRANQIACAKLGQNYAIPRNSVYVRILFARIAPARNRVLKCDAAYGLLGVFGIQLGPSEEAIKRVQEDVAELIAGAMIYPNINGGIAIDRPYQNEHFDKMLSVLLFADAKSKGCKNPESFEVVSLPLMALLATGLTRLLQGYSTGELQTSSNDKFSAETYAPIFRGHLTELKKAVEKNVGGICEYLKAMIVRARKPHEKAIARAVATTSAQAIVPVPGVISASAVASYARRTTSTQFYPSDSNSVISRAPPPSIGSITTGAPALNPAKLTVEETIAGIIGNGSLSDDEKARLLRRLCLSDTEPEKTREPREGSSVKLYNSALSTVDNASSDSEVEIRRAGVLMSKDERAKIVRADMSDDPDDLESEPEPKASRASKEGTGMAKGQKSRPTVEEDSEADTEDVEMQDGGDRVELEAKAGTSAAGDSDGDEEDDGDNDAPGAGEDGDDGEGEGESGDPGDDDEADSSADEDSAVPKSRLIFPASGSLSDPDPDSEDGHSSDGNGANGAVQAAGAVDGDTTMASINEDDD